MSRAGVLGRLDVRRRTPSLLYGVPAPLAFALLMITPLVSRTGLETEMCATQRDHQWLYGRSPDESEILCFLCRALAKTVVATARGSAEFDTSFLPARSLADQQPRVPYGHGPGWEALHSR